MFGICKICYPNSNPYKYPHKEKHTYTFTVLKISCKFFSQKKLCVFYLVTKILLFQNQAYSLHMASSKAITYAPNVEYQMESMTLTKKNVVGNFAYHEGFPDYRAVVKYLQNYFLSTAFTKTPLYHLS